MTKKNMMRKTKLIIMLVVAVLIAVVSAAFGAIFYGNMPSGLGSALFGTVAMVIFAVLISRVVWTVGKKWLTE